MSYLQTATIKRWAKSFIDGAFFLGGESKTRSDNWRFRRRLIYGAYRLSVAMIVFGAVTFFWDTGVSNNLVTGGIALLTIIVTAYTASATYEDVKKNRLEKHDYPEP
jgi:fructose-1,6-bisphosphatase/inositol monophosphatase family enzyme